MTGWRPDLPANERLALARAESIVERRAQGLPDEIEDPAVVAHLTALAFASDATPGHGSNSRSPVTSPGPRPMQVNENRHEHAS